LRSASFRSCATAPKSRSLPPCQQTHGRVAGSIDRLRQVLLSSASSRRPQSRPAVETHLPHSLKRVRADEPSASWSGPDAISAPFGNREHMPDIRRQNISTRHLPRSRRGRKATVQFDTLNPVTSQGRAVGCRDRGGGIRRRSSDSPLKARLVCTSCGSLQQALAVRATSRPRTQCDYTERYSSQAL